MMQNVLMAVKLFIGNCYINTVYSLYSF